MEAQKKHIHPVEWILILSGLFILASVFILFNTEDFTLWVAAKIFYAVGVIFFVIKY